MQNHALKHPQIDYKTLVKSYLNERNLKRSRNVHGDFLTFLSLVTGLSIKEDILIAKWEKLLTIGSYDQAIIKSEFECRNYSIPIDDEYKNLLSQYYLLLGTPNINDTIGESINIESRSISLLIKNSITHHSRKLKIRIQPRDAELLPSVLFTFNYFEENGYTNKTSKFIKNQLRLNTNKELCDFLKIDSTDELKLDLNKINFYATNKIELEDKNFNSGYPFMKFEAFENIILNSPNNIKDHDYNSVKIMLLLCLYNGIKPSALTKLTWFDISNIGKDTSPLKVKIFDHFVVKGRTYRIPENVKELLLKYLLNKHDYKSLEFEEPSIDNNFIGSIFDVAYYNPNHHVFMMNNNNLITQPSLLRTIKKFLNIIEFKHADKFTSKSPAIMFGRKVIEIKGNEDYVLRGLKEHFNIRTNENLKMFLKINQ